jgi:hypothetical protein
MHHLQGASALCLQYDLDRAAAASCLGRQLWYFGPIFDHELGACVVHGETPFIVVRTPIANHGTWFASILIEASMKKSHDVRLAGLKAWFAIFRRLSFMPKHECILVNANRI